MDPIDRYISRLKQALGARGHPSLFTEVEGHLREAVEQHQALGITAAEAEARAVVSFGPVDLIASEFLRVLEPLESEVVEFVRKGAALSEMIEVEVDRVRVGPVTEEEALKWCAGDPAQVEEALKHGESLHGVVLKERRGERELCVFVGAFEAAAIEFGREGKTLARPMTHDLFADLLESLDDLSLHRVTITRLQDKTFYAEMDTSHHGDRLAIDCRPSDGIAIALRLGAPLFVSADVPPFSQAA